jgi:hypothetical protein
MILSKTGSGYFERILFILRSAVLNNAYYNTYTKNSVTCVTTDGVWTGNWITELLQKDTTTLALSLVHTL